VDREWLSLRRQAEGYCQHNTLESPDDSCRGPGACRWGIRSCARCRGRSAAL